MTTMKQIIIYYKLHFAIVLFLIFFTTIHMIKPKLLYDDNGGFREFGVGYRNKTVIPIWIVSIVLAILCYLAISYYLMAT
jgi:hypothetical protein